MNRYALIGLAAMLIAAAFAITVTDESDGATEYPVTIFYHPNATIVFDGTTVHSPSTSEPYGYGDPITITATLATGYTFDHWYGNNITEGEDWTAYSSSSDITISGNVVTYRIWCYGETEFTLYLSGGTPTTHTITFNSDDWGTIDFDSAPMVVGNTLTVEYGTHFYISADQIVISTSPYANFVYAEPNPDTAQWEYFFYAWSWNEGNYTVTDDISITAYFDRTTARHTVSFTAGTGGSVSQNQISNIPYYTPISVGTGSNANKVTIAGTTVTATPDTGYVFDNWSNASGRVIGPRTITANFTQLTYTVTISAGTGGSVSQNQILNVPYGSQISVNNNTLTIAGTTVTATPANNYSFGSWSNASGTITSNRTITANFTAVPIYSVTIVHNSAYGYVSQSTVFNNIPEGTSITASGNVLTIGSIGTATATAKNATSTQTFRFDGWTGIPSNNKVTSNLTVTAAFSAHYKDFPVSVFYHPNATIYVDYETTPITSSGWSESIPYGDPIHIRAVLNTGYTFDHWYGNNITEGESWSAGPTSTGITISGNEVTYDTWCYGNTEFTLYLAGGPGASYTVTFQASPGEYGSMSSTTVTAQYGTLWYINADRFYIDGQVASRAVPRASDLTYTYSFDGWSTAEQSGTIVSDMTVTAYFSRAPVVHSDGVHWTNGNYNGRVDLLYRFADSDNKTHTMTMDLYDGVVFQDESTRWNASGYSLEIVQTYTSSISIAATLLYNGSPTDATATLNPGKWTSYVISINTDEGNVSIIPVKTFYSFTDYTLYDNQKRTVLDYSDTVKGSAILDILHTESDQGSNSPRFSVIGTHVFLNTFGVVLYNPTINLHDYFPQYEAIRVNFYSFALYGESITINGITYALDGSRITVQYVSDGSEHYLPGVMPNADVQTRTFELTNIYVTYQDGHCYLTFVNDRFTLDLGAYTPNNQTISMNGLWYFATMVYEPYTVTEKHLSDWKALPETSGSQMVLMFCGILIVAGAAVAIHVRKSGLGVIDLVVIGGALVVALLTLG